MVVRKVRVCAMSVSRYEEIHIKLFLETIFTSRLLTLFTVKIVYIVQTYLDASDLPIKNTAFSISSIAKKNMKFLFQRLSNICKKTENGENFSQALFLHLGTTKRLRWSIIPSKPLNSTFSPEEKE